MCGCLSELQVPRAEIGNKTPGNHYLDRSAGVAFGNVFATSSNVITAPNLGRCGAYSCIFEALQSRTVVASECGTTAFGAVVAQHFARIA